MAERLTTEQVTSAAFAGGKHTQLINETEGQTHSYLTCSIGIVNSGRQFLWCHHYYPMLMAPNLQLPVASCTSPVATAQWTWVQFHWFWWCHHIVVLVCFEHLYQILCVCRHSFFTIWWRLSFGHGRNPRWNWIFGMYVLVGPIMARLHARRIDARDIS